MSCVSWSMVCCSIELVKMQLWDTLGCVDVIDFFMCNSDVALFLVILLDLVEFVLKLLNCEDMHAVDCSDCAMSELGSPVSNPACWRIMFTIGYGW